MSADDIAVVRVLIPDLETGDQQLFTDAQLQSLLDLYDGNVKRAAASAIDAIANDEAMRFRAVRTDDLSVDGTKTAEALRKRAKSLRDEADDEDASMDYLDIVYPDGALPYPEEVPRWGW